MQLGSLDDWSRWIARGKFWWVSVLLVCFGMAWWTWLPHTQDTVRQLGLIYEVVGVLAVLIEVAQASAKNNLTPLYMRAAIYWRDLPLMARKKITVSGAAGSSVAKASARARGAVGLPPNPTPEQRMVWLEKMIHWHDDVIDALDARIEAEERRRTDAIKAEASQREQAIAQVSSKIKDVEIGGLDLTMYGVGWLLVGMMLSTGTVEICRWLLSCVSVL